MREERKVITALFADVVGSTALTERLDPEDVREVVGGVIERIIRCVEDFGGIIKDLAGDGVLALFGAPVTREDNEERAVLAGLRIVETINAYQGEVQRTWRESVSVRVGIDTGLAVVGPVGASGRVEYGAVGDVVNTAARLQSHAQPGSVLVSEATATHVNDMVDWGQPQQFVLKGKAEPVLARQAVSAVVRPTPADRGWQTSGVYVGRANELARLDQLIGAERDEPVLVFVTGEPGIGKSRLLVEWRGNFDRLTGSSGMWLQSHCWSLGTSTPLQPIRRLLADLFWPGNGQTSAVQGGSLDQVGTSVLGDSFDQHAPFLKQLLNLEASDRSLLSGLASEELQEGQFAAVEAVLAALCQHGLVAVVVEDLHWADPTTIALLERLTHSDSLNGALVIITLRPEIDTAAWRLKQKLVAIHPAAEEVDLVLLSGPEEKQLLHILVGEGGLSEEVEQRVLAAAEGNPFYLLELLRSFQDAGALTMTSHGYRLDTNGPVEVPPTVERVILSRTDRLDDTSHQVLQVGAVIGRQFSLNLVADVLSGVSSVPDAVKVLTERQLIRDLSKEGLEFHHALTQETVYRSLLKRTRRNLHEQVADSLERLDPHNLDVAAELGHHLSTAQLPHRALPYFRAAADSARQSYANQEALDLYAKALKECDKLRAENPLEWAEPSADLWQLRGETWHLIGEYNQASECFQSALEVATDPLHQAVLYRWIALAMEGDHKAALPILSHAEALLDRIPAEPAVHQERIENLLAREALLYMLNDLEQQQHTMSRLRPLVEEHATAVQRGDFYSSLVSHANRLNRFVVTDATLDNARKAAQARHELNIPRESGWADFSLGFNLLWHGDVTDSVPYLKRGLTFAEESGEVVLQSRCLTYLTVAARLQGDVERTDSLLPRMFAAAQDAHLQEYTAMAFATQSWLHWRQGNLAAAEASGKKALTLWRDASAAYPFNWMALWPLIGIAVRRNKWKAAFNLAEQLFAQDQQPPPPQVAEAVRKAKLARDRHEYKASQRRIKTAMRLASRLGHL